MRRKLLERVAIRTAAEWLDQRPQLGRDVFVRGGVAARASSQGRTGDVTDLFRACLVVLSVPEQVDAYQLRFIKLWRVRDAMAQITRMLEMRPQGGALASFLPTVDAVGSDKELRCRAAVASTFLAGLELARDSTVAINQGTGWQAIFISRC